MKGKRNITRITALWFYASANLPSGRKYGPKFNNDQRCFYRTLWHHREVDLWPFGCKHHHFFVLSLLRMAMVLWSHHDLDLWPQKSVHHRVPVKDCARLEEIPSRPHWDIEFTGMRQMENLKTWCLRPRLLLVQRHKIKWRIVLKLKSIQFKVTLTALITKEHQGWKMMELISSCSVNTTLWYLTSSFPFYSA